MSIIFASFLLHILPFNKSAIIAPLEISCPVSHCCFCRLFKGIFLVNKLKQGTWKGLSLNKRAKQNN